jgi:CheY-like chemotaxis protein
MTRRVVAIVDDMFFASKIRATAEALGVEIAFPRTKESAIEKISQDAPQLVVIDLHNQRLNGVEFGRELKGLPEMQSVPLLGFFSHVEVELQRQAVNAGFDQVIPRSMFARDLASILIGAK